MLNTAGQRVGQIHQPCRRKQPSVVGEAKVSASGPVHCCHPACSAFHSLAPVHPRATTPTPTTCNVPHPQHMYTALPLLLLLCVPGYTFETPQPTAFLYCRWAPNPFHCFPHQVHNPKPLPVTRVGENWLAPTGGHGCPFPNPPPPFWPAVTGQ